MTMVARGFEVGEFRNRLAKAQGMMVEAGLAALLLTTEPEIRYFTGFLTRFWESTSRPWFLLVPATGEPVAVIPSIGAELMGQSWIRDIRTWRSPSLSDDGVSLLAETLAEFVSSGGRIGVPMGHETHVRMPLTDFHTLSERIKPLKFVADEGIMRALRLVKSPAEIAKIKQACGVAGRAFARVGEIAGAGVGLDEVFRRFQMLCLEEGADWVAYLAGGAGPSGYGDVISPATPEPLQKGDVLMLDTGLVWDGYFCDFDRNFSVGAPTAQAAKGHTQLMEAVEAALAMVKPGVTAADIFHAMDKIVTGGKGGSEAGRFGHGLGMQLTEWPSLIPDDHTVIKEGMVLTLEPGVETGSGRIMVHEENIVVTASGAEMLSALAGPQLVEV